MDIRVNMEIKFTDTDDAGKWDEYVHVHPQATLYHLYGWRNVIKKTYGHKTYYLMAEKSDGSVAGILPLVHLSHFIFGNSLISMPFFDMGGILADDWDAEKAILNKAVSLGKKVRAQTIELRHGEENPKFEIRNPEFETKIRSDKVRMILRLPESSEVLMKSFKSKLRSQIKKPMKSGLRSKIGGPELLDDFYEVFLINMRDLGSPVHSKHLMKNVLGEFPDKAEILMIYKENQPLACSLVAEFRGMLENPWASALREYGRLSPNMLLYWAMLEHACDRGCQYFDLGRSTPNEGTYKFKAQWGAKPWPLNWYYLYLNGAPHETDMESSQAATSKFDRAVQYWKKLPVPLTRVIGPMIRKHIGL